MRGHAFARILTAHKESWWDNELMNINADPDLQLPLQLSENQSSFLPLAQSRLVIDGSEFRNSYLAPHTNLNIFGRDKEFIKKILYERQKPNNKNKYFFTLRHPSSSWNISRYIHLYASKQNTKRQYKCTEAKDCKNVINVDISKLFSYIRSEFDDEYCKLLNTFEFSALFTSVRNFILQMLDRESSINDFYKKL
tara:strand:+ start:155 stop:739 length:585 start_codon:yes stop_codon:yes gene_type:complete